MTVGDLRKQIEDLPDGMDIVVCHGPEALYVCGFATGQLGSPATFKDSTVAIVSGPTVFEIRVRDHA